MSEARNTKRGSRVTENLDGKVWEEPTLEVLGDLAMLTAAGGVTIPDGGMTTGNIPS